MNYTGLRVLITGAAQRVGHAVALDLAARGAHIAFSWLDEREPWKAAHDALAAHGGTVWSAQADVTRLTDIDTLVAGAAKALGGIDVLINNASIWTSAPALSITEAQWDAEMAINVKAPFFMAQRCAPYLKASGCGVIVNIADLSAFQVWPGYAHHAAAKSALVAVTKSLAVELAPEIRVNAIAPGTVLLPDNADQAKRDWAISKSALKRVGTPDDVARTLRYLVEEDFATGGVYFVDGGRALV
jgi:NAD(P)-dependent dehydrogenase (short-subunit alcohol dehydrogenase family)